MSWNESGKKKQKGFVEEMDKRAVDKRVAADASEGTPVIDAVMRLEGFRNVASPKVASRGAALDNNEGQGAMQTPAREKELAEQSVAEAKEKQRIHIDLDSLPPPAMF